MRYTRVQGGERSVQTAAIDIPLDRVAELCRLYNVRELSLFGSALTGDFGPDSDVDLLVVFPHLENPRGTAVDIAEALGGFSLAKDVVVTTPEEIARRGHLIGTVLEPALREGRILYERG